MRATEAYGELQRIGRPIISTREAAARLGVSIPRASNLLKSFAEDGSIIDPALAKVVKRLAAAFGDWVGLIKSGRAALAGDPTHQG